MKILFEELDTKFNLEGIFNKELDKLKSDLDVLQSRVNISTDALVRELKLANDKIAIENLALREKCEVVNE